MPPDVRACEAHGYFPGGRCPDCDRPGRRVLDGGRRRRLSKFVSGALRHFPEDAGLELDDAGWTPFVSLADAVEGKYGWADAEALAAVVATDPKGRFERDERDGTPAIRAAYGHSVDVDLGSGGEPVPDTLYHGTAPRHGESIREEGLCPMGRQHVHLSGTAEAAREVGRRHADDPVVFVVDAAGLVADGHDVTKRGRDVYTTDRVPPRFLDGL